MLPHDEYKWGVHINGPDTVVAAKDFTEAFEKSVEITKSFMIEKSSHIVGFYPAIFATVFIWDESRQGKHDPSQTDWSDLG